MEINVDIWLILLSLLASSFAMFVTFNFVNSLYHATASGRSFLLPIYSLTVGSGLLGIHFINFLAFNNGHSMRFSTLFMLASWLAAIFVGFVLCYVSSKKIISLRLLALSGLLAGISSYGMFYLCLISLHSADSVSFDVLSFCISLILAVGTCVLALLTLSWMKEHSGKNALLIKLIFSIVMAFAIIGLYIIFNASAFTQTNTIIAEASAVADKKMLAAIISLAIVCLFLLVFVVVLFYEKLGKNTFKLTIQNSQKSIDAQYMKDTLTNLPDRGAFQHLLEMAIKRSDRAGSTIALAYIDLDYFKPINDNYGHHVGDALLKSVAQRLQDAVRGCDYMARLGGDEFAAVIEEIKSDDDIIPIVKRIVKSIHEPFYIDKYEIEISCSVGIAIYPRDGDMEKLMICADAAMYKAKENGKNQFKFYDAEIESATDQVLEIQNDLRSAIKNEEFSLVFQPKMDCATQKIVGAEALVRWKHPSKGKILPKDFIPVAEHCGLINPINDWVMRQACSTIRQAKDLGFDLDLSVNLSRQQFHNTSLVEDTIKWLERFEVPSQSLTVEIKETTAIRNENQFKRLMTKFKEANIRIALDDFGLHPFTLTYLQDLDVDELKLDKIFVSKINEKKSKALIDAVIRLAHALNFNVVAEGIETESQRDALIALGCNQMQGYLFSKPLNEQQLFELLAVANLTSQLSFADYQPAAA